MFNYHSLDYDKELKNNQIPTFLTQYNTLAFNSRHITKDDDIEEFNKIIKFGKTQSFKTQSFKTQSSKKHQKIPNKLYLPYPPIIDTNPEAKVCQFETTIYIDKMSNVINYKQHQELNQYLLI